MALPLPARDGELVALALRGRDDAFGALYERYFTNVYDFLTRLLRDRQEAADVTQDTFIKAFERLGHLENPEAFKSWLFTIAHRNGLNRIARSKRAVAVGDLSGDNREAGGLAVVDLDRAGDPERSAEAQAAARLIWEAAAGLDPRTYAVMDLHVRQGLDSAEIADVLGVSKPNAYTMVSRMKKSFSRTLSTYMLVRNGVDDCRDLAAIVAAAPDAGLTPELRKAVDRHAKSCEGCEENRKVLFVPLRLFAALAVVPVPVGLQASVWGGVQAAGIAAGAVAAEAVGGTIVAAGAGTASTAAGTTAAVTAFVQANVAWLVAAAVVLGVAITGTVLVIDGDDAPTEVLSAGVTADSTAAPEPPATGAVPDSTTAPPPPTTTLAPAPATSAPPPVGPTAVGDSATLDEDSSVVIAVLANDSGYRPGAVPRIAAEPRHGTTTVIGDSIRYTPQPDYAGDDRFAYSVDDDTGAVGTAQVTLTITGINDAPDVPGPGVLTIGEDETLAFDPLAGAVDVDGDRLAVTAVDSVSEQGGSVTSGSIVYQPPLDWSGTDKLRYTVSDGTVDVVVTVAVTVTAVNDPPSGPDPVLEVAEDGTGGGNILTGWSDVEGDPVSIADPGTRSTAAGGSATVEVDGGAAYAPPADFAGTDDFTVTVTDGIDTVTVTVIVEVRGTNDPPQVVAPTYTVAEATAPGQVIGVIQATDPDGDEITFEQLGTGVAEIRSDGTVVLTAPLDFEQAPSHQIAGRAADGFGAATDFVVTIDVTDSDESPVVLDATFTVAPDAPAGTTLGTLRASDPEGDPVAFRLQNTNGWVAADPDSGVVTLLKDVNPPVFPIVVTILVSDPAGNTGRGTLTLALADVDSPEISGFAADVASFYEPPADGGVCPASPRLATFTATITDSSGVRGADLHWRITVAGVETTGIVKMRPGDGRWEAQLTVPPGVLADGNPGPINSRVRARDDFGHFSWSDEIGLTLLPCTQL